MTHWLDRPRDEWQIQENYFVSNILGFIEEARPKFLGIAVIDLHAMGGFDPNHKFKFYEHIVAKELEPFLEERLHGKEKGIQQIEYASFPFALALEEEYPDVPDYPRVFLVAESQPKNSRQTSLFVKVMNEFPDNRIFQMWMGKKDRAQELIGPIKDCSGSCVGDRLFMFMVYPQPMPIANITYMLRYFPPLLKRK